MNTYNMFSWRSKKQISWIPLLLWRCASGLMTYLITGGVFKWFDNIPDYWGVYLGSGLMTNLITGGVFRKWFDDIPDYWGYI